MPTYAQGGSFYSVGAKDDPSTTSKDHQSMCRDWEMIHDILDGARCIQAAGNRYLPRFQGEYDSAYQLRLKAAPWRPEFADAHRSLCSKPFTKEVVVNPDAPDVFLGEVVDEKTKKRQGGIVDDIDGQGNSLHVFARQVFQNAVAYGLAAIYVTYPANDPAKTRADELASGTRPYWVEIRAENIIALLTRVVAGRTVVSDIRIKECTIEPDGFAEVEVERIRRLKLDDNDLPTWQTFTKQKEGKYISDGDPQPLLGVTEIPVALFFTGERSGNYRVKIPLIDLAHMQIELYRALSRLDQLLTLTSPMLVMKGVRPPTPTPIIVDGVQTGERPAPQQDIGPGIIIYAFSQSDTVQPSADYIQPAAANIEALGKNVDGVMEDFRRLAMQPTTPKSGNMVATGQAIDAAKANSAVEAWANGLADTLNQALMYTAQWLKIPDTVTAVVGTDFGVDVQGAEEMKLVMQGVTEGWISQQTGREELARRAYLGPQFDEGEDEKRREDEQAGQDEINTLVPEQAFDPVTGKPIAVKPGAVDPLTGKPIKPAPAPAPEPAVKPKK